MSRPLPTQPDLSSAELEQAMSAFSQISESLVQGYAELAERAERVEHELGISNRALEQKVQELDNVKRGLEAILRALPTGVVVRDSAGHITRVNDAALEILEACEEDVLGRREIEHLSGTTREGSLREVERHDRRRLVLSTRTSPIQGADGSRNGSVEILDDRTEVTALTERLHAMDKVAALGTMAGGIAHEIRNPLNATMGFAALLQRELSSDTKAHRWASHIVEGCREADAIIASMMSLANPEGLHLEAVDAGELLADAAALVFPVGAGKSPWELELTASAPRFQGDRIKLRQAVRNLVANAVSAQPEGGAIHAELLLREGEILVRVGDAGPGVEPSARPRLFDPFYTTRADGTGLGLALVAAIAQVHGGAAELSTSPCALGGAEFHLRIPYVPVS